MHRRMMPLGLAMLCASALVACETQTSVQRAYIAERDVCQAEAEAMVSAASDSGSKERDRNTKLVSLFSDCMDERGWTVATPTGKSGGKGEPAVEAIKPPAAAATQPQPGAQTQPQAYPQTYQQQPYGQPAYGQPYGGENGAVVAPQPAYAPQTIRPARIRQLTTPRDMQRPVIYQAPQPVAQPMRAAPVPAQMQQIQRQVPQQQPYVAPATRTPLSRPRPMPAPQAAPAQSRARGSTTQSAPIQPVVIRPVEPAGQ